MLVEASSELWFLKEDHPSPALPKTHYQVIRKKKSPGLLMFIPFYLNRDPKVTGLVVISLGILTQTSLNLELTLLQQHHELY